MAVDLTLRTHGGAERGRDDQSQGEVQLEGDVDHPVRSSIAGS
jgi:hypothetical protein